MMPNNPFAPRQYGSLEQVSERVYCFRNIVNSAIFVGDKGLAVVDTQVNHALARRLVATLKKEFNKPILYAINTHYHWDHTNGNQIFADAGATIVGNKDTKDFMVSKAPRQKGFLASRGFRLGPDPLLPEILIEDQNEFDLGNLTVRCSRGHAAETDDPTLIYCPEENILAGGDTIMTGSFPIFGQPSQREGLENDNWLKALDEVRGFKASAVLSGHGPVAYEKELQCLEDIIRYFLDEVRTEHAKGVSLEECIDNIEHRLPAWIGSIQEVWGTPRYAILRVWAGLEDLGEPGWQHKKPTAIPAAEKELKINNEQDETAWLEQAEQAHEGGDLGLAIETLRAAAEALPQSALVRAQEAQYLIEASRGIKSVLEKGDCFDRARSLWNEAHELDNNCFEALLGQAQFEIMMAYRNGDDTSPGTEAIEKATALAEEASDKAQCAFYKGMAARTNGDEAGAKTAYQEAIEFDPNFMPARLAMMA